jgi:hypothetical protein
MISKAPLVTISGPCAALLNAPYIYLIEYSTFAYIGETQSHPVMRWGAHLSQQGTFSNNLRKIPQIFQSVDQVNFIAVRVDHLMSSVDRQKWRLSCQWIEHRVHVLFTISKLGVRYSLISDTSRSAPIAPPAPGLEDVAKEAFQALTRHLPGKNLLS